MGTQTQRRVAIYVRQSLDRGEGIQAQRKRCTELAASRGWDVIDVFEDNETRASKARDNNTAWGQMLALIGKDFDVIVSVDLDRLLRSTKDLNTLIDLGAAVVTVDGEIDLTSADGEFRATMIAGIARFETRRASERQKRHKAAKAERGEWHGGTPPFGYALDRATKSLIPEPREVDLIQEAASRLLDRGQSLHSIVVEWNNRGERTRRGHHWRQTGLRPILLNSSMLGITSAGTQGWEPIVSQQTFNRLAALLHDPSRKVVHSPGANGGKRALGGGLTVCGLCGKPLISHSKSVGRGAGTSTATLGCLARVHGPSDKHPRVKRIRTRNGQRVEVWEDTGRVSVSHDVLEEIVFENVIAALEDTDRWKARMQEKSPRDESQLIELESRQRTLNDELEGVGRAVMVGAWDERRAKTEVARIKQELARNNEDISSLLGKPMLNAIAQGGKLQNWREWTAIDRRSFLKLMIDRVEVHPYPDGAARSSPRRNSEADEAYARRKREIVKSATAQRIKIVWTWGPV